MLTAEEIKNVSFKTTGIIMKGYDCSEVDGFVKKTAETVSELNDRIKELEEKLKVH